MHCLYTMSSPSLRSALRVSAVCSCIELSVCLVSTDEIKQQLQHMKDFLNQSKLGAEEAEDIEGDRFKEVITISFVLEYRVLRLNSLTECSHSAKKLPRKLKTSMTDFNPLKPVPKIC